MYTPFAINVDAAAPITPDIIPTTIKLMILNEKVIGVVVPGSTTMIACSLRNNFHTNIQITALKKAFHILLTI